MLVISWLAWAVGLGLGAAWIIGRRRLTLIAALAWFGYGVYEYLMHARVLCTGECNIRVDLLVLWPALIGVLIAVGIGYVKRLWQTRAAAGK
jgi:hypothetical protein